MDCPKCGAKCEADFVDIGVGEERCSPWRCPECQWVEPTEPDPFVDYEIIDGPAWEE